MTSRGLFHYFTVDALKVCYKIPKDVFNQITDSNKDIWGFNYNPRFKKVGDNYDFLLVRMEKTRFKFELRVLDDQLPNNYLRFGTLRLSPKVEDFANEETNTDEEVENYDDFSNYCFIELENNIFYSPIVTYHQPQHVEKVNLDKANFTYTKKDPKQISTWEMGTTNTKATSYIKSEINSVFMVNLIANFLGLELYQIIHLEVACDTNVNYVKHISKALRNDNIVVKVNNHDYKDAGSNERIPGLFYFFSASRKSRQNQSIYVTQSHKGLQIKFYDKTQELAYNSTYKTYIADRYNKACEIHRVEITAKKQKIKSYCQDEKIDLEDFLFNLCDENYLVNPFLRWSDSLITFRTVKMRKGESLFNVTDLLKK